MFMIRRDAARAFNATSSVFPDIDTESLASRMQLRKRGLERGGQDLPPSDQAGFDIVENEIVDAVGSLRRQGLNSFEQHLKVYATRIARSATERSEIASIASRTDTEFQAEVSAWRNHIANEKAHVADAYLKFDDFRKKHRRIGAPLTGSGWFKFLSIAAFMLVVEAVMNGFLFREASSQGALGGFFVAFVIAALNVLLAAICARIGRYLNHTWFFLKLFGFAGFVAGLACAFGMGLAAAHYRDMALRLQDLAAARNAALQRLIASPLTLDSVESWFLVGLSLVIALITAWKAVGIDDPYPGFTQHWKHLREARESYANVVDDAIETLRNKSEEASEDLTQRSEDARLSVTGAIDAVHGATSLRGHLRTFLESCDQKARMLLGIYWESNAETRTGPRPPHFSKSFAFEPFSIPEADLSMAENARRDEEKIASIVEKTVERIRESAKAAIDAFPSIDELEAGTVCRPGSGVPGPETAPDADRCGAGAEV